jgi:hypothetical protein
MIPTSVFSIIKLDKSFSLVSTALCYLPLVPRIIKLDLVCIKYRISKLTCTLSPGPSSTIEKEDDEAEED